MNWQLIRRTAMALPAFLLAGCGGGQGGGQSEQELTFGRVVTRVVGTAQPPVTTNSLGATVTGVAGASVTSLVVNNTDPGLDTTRIAFVAANDIFTMASDGTAVTNITNNAAVDIRPAWSPDGKKVAFTTNRDGNGEIYVMNADGTGLLRLTNNTATDQQPTWSPDGAKIAFSSKRDGNFEIYSMNADGTAQTRLTNNPASDDLADWSPDGKKIAFSSDRDGNVEIYTMNPDGTGQTRLTNNTFSDDQPSWSPDSSKIAFTSDRDGNDEVYVMNLNGTGQTRLTVNSALDGDPTWSPDGKRIAFHSNRDGILDIYTMSSTGGPATRVTFAKNATAPDWGPPLRSVQLIGTGGSFSAGAAGFLFATTGNDIASVVAFDATTRSGARVSAQSGQNTNGPNVVFEVTASDSITRLQFMNSLVGQVTTVVGTGNSVTTATNAIVSFDSANGDVAFVLPFTANRSAALRTPIRNGSTVVYRGSFYGAWDHTGTNRAPNGASEVRVDAMTGRIVACF